MSLCKSGAMGGRYYFVSHFSLPAPRLFSLSLLSRRLDPAVIFPLIFAFRSTHGNGEDVEEKERERARHGDERRGRGQEKKRKRNGILYQQLFETRVARQQNEGMRAGRTV